MKIVESRETCLQEILSLTQTLESMPEAEQSEILDQIETNMKELRRLSIRCVELVVLWRDQFRYLALIGTKQRAIRKRRAQTAIQVPYLTSQNVNYLLKIKTDTACFASLPISKHFNFAPEGARSDPFLIQTSVSGNIVAGNRARALRKGKEGGSLKRTLPLGEDDMSKAKACEEMILYERPFSAVSNNAPSQSPMVSPANLKQAAGAKAADVISPVPLEFPAPNGQMLSEFAVAVENYIKETTLVSVQSSSVSHQSIEHQKARLNSDSPSPDNTNKKLPAEQ